MSGADYDEDLETNPFFVAVRENFPDLFQQCLAEGLVVAVPRRGSIAGVNDFTRDQVLRHVLVVSEDFSLTRFHSLDGIVEVIAGGVGEVVRVVSVGDDDDVDAENDAAVETSTRLLFTETFYDDDMNKLQLWCVADPLVKISRLKSSPRPDLIDPAENPSTLLTDPTSVKECVDFLVQFVGGQPLLAKIQALAKHFETEARTDKMYVQVFLAIEL